MTAAEFRDERSRDLRNLATHGQSRCRCRIRQQFTGNRFLIARFRGLPDFLSRLPAGLTPVGQ